MKFKRIIRSILGVMAIFILGMICGKFLNNEEVKEIVKEENRIVIENGKNDNNLYIENENNNKKIYLNGIISIKDREKELKDIYNSDYFENLLKDMEYVDTKKEYTKYIDFGKLSKDGFSIIKCNQFDNYYIGPKNLEYNSSMCANPKVGKTIIRTYEVFSVVPSNDYNYIYITIRAYQDEEVAVVKIKRSLNESIEVGKNYEFTFKITENYVEDNAASIFANLELLKVEYTDKVGMGQINDNL